MDDFSEAVVAGIWYADGTFGFEVSPKMNHILPRLSIANNDLGLLTFVGSVWESFNYSVTAHELREGKWEVKLGVFSDLVKFAKVVLSFPGDGKKRQQLEIFLEEFVPIYEGRAGEWRGRGRVWSKAEFLKAMEVVDKIASLKSGKGVKRKYSKDYFVVFDS